MMNPQDLLASATAYYNAAVAYLNDNVPGAAFPTFEQQLLDAGAAGITVGAQSRQAEVDALQVRLAAAQADATALDAADAAADVARGKLHQDVGG
jgi:hypothetical protein